MTLYPGRIQSIPFMAQDILRIVATDAWIAEWQGLARGYALMPPELYATLAARGVPMRELARDPRRVIVSRQ